MFPGMNALALLVLCLVVWFPTVSHAQSEAASAPASDAPVLPPLVTAPEEPPEGEVIPGDRLARDAGPDLIVPRLILSPIVGGAAAAGGSILGFLLGLAASGCDLSEGCDDEVAVFSSAAFTGWVAGSLSVYGLGNLLNGMGTLWPTMLGGAVGMGLGVALLFATEGTTWYLTPLVPGLGAAIGYEISNASVRANLPPERDEFAGVQLLPVVSATPRGGFMGGLVGRF